MALTRVTSGGIAPGVEIKFDQNNDPTAPAISFDTDTDTGIYSPEPNTIAISTGGVERFKIGPNGELSFGSIGGNSYLPITDSSSTGVTGKTIYVNINDSKADDSIDNDGENIGRPFKTIERALIEASRKSYVPGVGQSAGEAGADLFEYFTIMVYPGQYQVDNRPGVFEGLAPDWNGDYSASITENTLSASDYYKFNAQDGGIIVPRGTSIVGMDLRKTIVTPKYVPDPTSGSSLETSVFKLTGGCYIWQITIKDAIGQPYSSQTAQYPNANFSHHKLAGFKFASTEDLNSYYRKIDVLDGNIPLSGTSIFELYKRTEENRIVGNLADASSVDTVSSASPYVFNCSVRSVWGLNGLHADGARATGFKSMVLAQYTSISLQKDNRAFVGSSISGGATQVNGAGIEYRLDPNSRYRDDWRHYHIKASNDAFLQVVSVFAVGNADHFIAETGGDMSITNSNSNFGNTAIKSISHKPTAFPQDSGGFIVGVVPPRGLNPDNDTLVSLSEIDVGATVDSYNAVSNANKGKFAKIYIKINGKSEIAEDDIPEYYTTDNSGAVIKSELLVNGLDYNLGKRTYTDSRPEAVYAYLPATPIDATSKLFGARLRERDSVNYLDPAVSQNGVTTKNNVRTYYAWEYTKTENGVDLGRVCLLVDDNRAVAPRSVTGIPTSFTYNSNGATYEDIIATSTLLCDAELSNSSGDLIASTGQSTPIKVYVTVNGTSHAVTAIAPYNPNNNFLDAGSGFSTNDYLRIKDGPGSPLGIRTGTGPLVIKVNGTTTLSNVSYAPGNIKPIGYIPFSSIGGRYYPIDESDTLENQNSNELSLLRRLTQRVDTNGDNQTSDGGADLFEFDSNTTVNIYIKRLQDNRQNFGEGELLWRLILKLPKGSTSSQELRAPEGRFVLQLRDNNSKYPFTYTTANTYPKSYYIYKTETVIEYQRGVRDGYYLLTVLDGNIFTNYDGSYFTNTLNYSTQTSTSTGYTINDVTVTGLGVPQNINYLYPEIDLDNPKWNSRPAESRYRSDVGNTLPLDTNLVSHSYDRITQYSITSESVKNLLNNVLAGGSIQANLTNELNLNTYFGVATINDAKMIAPYSNSALNLYGVDKEVVSSFTNNVPTFTERAILFGNNVTTNATAGTPVNLHRPSIIRASGHTWEYVGFGPGNYSTALPRFQTKVLPLQQQVNSQQIESSGGFVASSGTNSNGDFFIGNQIIDTKGNQSNTLNFPRVKTSADNKLIDFADVGSLSSNSAASSFNPSSFSATLTQSLASLQQAQQNSFKTANLEATTATIGTLKVQSKVEFASSVFQTTGNYPAADQNNVGFAQRAQQDWFNLSQTSTDWNAQSNKYISPQDLIDWANKNAFITTIPIAWPLALSDIPAAGSFTVNNAGSVSDDESLKLSSNFNLVPLGSITDSRWYNSSDGTVKLVLGSISDLSEYNGRSGQIYATYSQSVKLASILPENIWEPVALNWRGIDDATGAPVEYLEGTIFLITYYINNGKMVYVTNVVQ